MKSSLLTTIQIITTAFIISGYKLSNCEETTATSNVTATTTLNTTFRRQAEDQQQDGNLTLTLSEQLVKQSNLQAEESQQAASFSALPPPQGFVGQVGALQRDNDWRNENDRANESQNPKSPASFTGGSGNSYMSLSRDGSNRYEFGFDTDKSQRQTQEERAQQQQQLQQESEKPKERQKSPRLMREETRLEDGTVIGRYGYTDPFNVFRIVQYVAGADGYFATEDVGALVDESNGNKFQLNKNLHKALEQARAQRRLSKATRVSSAQKSSSRANVVQVIQPDKRQSDENLSSAETIVNNGVVSSGFRRDDGEALSESGSHQSIRYATRINHVIGNNGLSYATAFRPVVNNRPRQIVENSQEQSSPGLLLKNSYEPVRSPHLFEANNRQHNYQQRLLSQTKPQPHKYDDLRSKLPAPIYKPSSFGLSFSVDHTVPSDSSYSSQDEQGQLYQEEANVGNLDAFASPKLNPIRFQSARVLQSSPAWNVLTNNYGTAKQQQIHQSSLIIDHSNSNHQSQNNLPSVGIVGSQIVENFNHEAKLLDSLKRQKPNFGTAYNYNAAPPATPNQEEANHQNQDSATDTSQEWSPSNYNAFGMALKQFNPPLYHPEVHETKPVDLVDTKAPVVYSSTIVHSEISAEQAYKPERLQTSNTHYGIRPIINSDADILQRSSSEKVDNELSSSTPTNSTLSKSNSANKNTDSPMIVDNSTRELARSSSASSPGRQENTSARHSHVGQNDQNVFDHSVRYATRLTGLPSTKLITNADDDLYMENSEQVSYIATANGTSRARLPDRSKKLSSIFKARTSNTDEAGGTSSGGRSAKIRRPIPVNMKNKQSDTIRVDQATNLEPQVLETSEQTNENQTKQQIDTRPSAHEELISAKPTTNKVGLSKKFGKGTNVIDKSSSTIDIYSGTDNDSVTQVSVAKRRPNLRAESKKIDTSAQQESTTTRSPVVSVPSKTASSTTSTNIIQSIVSNDITTTTNTSANKSPSEVPLTQTKKGTSLEHSPTATIIDATDQSGGDFKDSKLDKSLYEKIVKIQREIAARTLTTSSTPVPTTKSLATSSTTTTTTTTAVPSTTVPNRVAETTSPIPKTTTELDTTSTMDSRRPAETTTTVKTLSGTSSEAPKTTTAQPATTKSTMTRTSTLETVSQNTSQTLIGESQVNFENEVKQELSRLLTDNLTNTKAEQTIKHDDSTGQFLTGPLVAMDSSMDQNDFLMKLTQDMDSFDSARASLIDTPSQASQRSLQFAPMEASITTTQADSQQEPSTTTTAPVVVPTTITQASKNATTRPSLSAQETFAAPPTAIRDTEWITNSANTSSHKNGDPTTATSRLPLKVETTTQVSTTSSSIPTTMTPTKSMPETSTTQATTTPAPLVSKRPTTRARFDRLVIKKGDKVVARFNASEPIPDSMIPIGGDNSEIIVPDMPRLGMRRPVKKRVSQTASRFARIQNRNSTETSNNITSTTTTTTLPTTTIAATTTVDSKLSTKRANLGQNNEIPESANKTSLVMMSLSGASIQATKAAEQQDNSTASVSQEIRRAGKSLLRGPRSYGDQIGSEDDLMFSESNLATRTFQNRPSQPEQPEGSEDKLVAMRELRRVENVARPKSERKTETTTVPNSMVAPMKPVQQPVSFGLPTNRSQTASNGLANGGRNWSSRMRDSVNGTRPNNKRYDPKEDLEKLVEKISKIERSREQDLRSHSMFQESAIELRKPAKRIEAKKKEASSIGRLREDKQTMSSSSSNSTVKREDKQTVILGTRLENPKSLIRLEAFTTSTPPIAAATNQSTTPTGVLVSIQSFDINTNSSTNNNIANKTTSSVGRLELIPVNSKLINVISNRTSDKMSAMLGDNSTNSGKIFGFEPKFNLTMPLASHSSSVSFTVTMSPDLEKHWQQLKPINSTNLSSNTSFTANSSKLDEIRVNSHGHIHVRNNQSMTIHVDIEPPRRQDLVVKSGTDKGGAISSMIQNQKRLVNRDTTAVATGAFGNKDIQRLPANLRSLLSRDGASIMNEPALENKRQESAQVDSIRKRPKMLCIEVDSDNPAATTHKSR